MIEIKENVAYVKLEEARSALVRMKSELKTIPETCHTKADREYRFYLQMNISNYQTSIKLFEKKWKEDRYG